MSNPSLLWNRVYRLGGMMPLPRESRNDMIVGVVFMVLSIGVLIVSADYPVSDRNVGVRTFPLILGILVGGLGLLLLLRAIRGGRQNRASQTFEALNKEALIRILVTTVAIAVFVALVNVLGFIITSILFLAFVSTYYGERRVGVIAAFSVLGVIVVYLMFGMLARVPFPRGPIEELLLNVGIV